MTATITTMIATAGRPDLLKRTLDSLAACAPPASYRGTIVIENGGVRGAEDVVRNAAPWLKCRYLYESLGNKSAALNRGLADLTDQDLVFFADDDVRFAPDVLTAYVQAAAGATGGVIMGGPTRVDFEVAPAPAVYKRLPLSARGWSPTEAELGSSDLAFLGFNWAAFVTDLRAAGGFDPDRGPGAASGSTGQEGEMQARLRRAGVKPRFVSRAIVWHYIPVERCTPEWVVDRAFRHGVSRGLDAPAGLLGVAGCPAWVVARLGKSLLRRTIAPFVPDAEFRLDARAKHSYNRGLIRGFRLRRRGGAGDGRARAGAAAATAVPAPAAALHAAAGEGR